MSEPFLGEVRLFPIGYAPRGWEFCQGQIKSINTNQALFSLLGNVYGGDGITTFALPDYRGRVPIHTSSAIPLGTSSGEENHTLTTNEIPQHTHQASASSSSNLSVTSPTGAVWGDQLNGFSPAASLVPMSEQAIAVAGSSQPHSNMQPFLALNYCIATQGIFPSRN